MKICCNIFSENSKGAKMDLINEYNKGKYSVQLEGDETTRALKVTLAKDAGSFYDVLMTEYPETWQAANEIFSKFCSIANSND
jgi:hypothetical protein